MSLDRKRKTNYCLPTNELIYTRKEQLTKWKNSPTALQSATPREALKIKFPSGISFHAACCDTDTEDALSLLKNGADVNSTNYDHMTALHQACIDDNIEIIEFLLNNGCDVNAQDIEGWTSLHAAAHCGYADVVELLLSRGADSSITNNDNELAIDLPEDEETTEILRAALVEKEVDVDAARDREHKLMLEDATRWQRIGCSADFSDKIDNLTMATPLHVAAAKDYTDVLEILLKCRGIELDARDKDGWTALHAAAHWGHRDAARLLCEAGCDVHAVTTRGETPLDVANPDIVTFMRQLKERFGVKLRRREIHLRDQEIRCQGVPRRSSVIRHSMVEKNATRMQKELSPMVFLMESVVLKKTLSSIFPHEAKEAPVSSGMENQPSKISQYRQKMLSLFEAVDGPETPRSDSQEPSSLTKFSFPSKPTVLANSEQDSGDAAKVNVTSGISKTEVSSAEICKGRNLSLPSTDSYVRPGDARGFQHRMGIIFESTSSGDPPSSHNSLSTRVSSEALPKIVCSVDTDRLDNPNSGSSSEVEETTSLDDLDDEHVPALSPSVSVSSGGVRIVSQCSQDTARSSVFDELPEDTSSSNLSPKPDSPGDKVQSNSISPSSSRRSTSPILRRSKQPPIPKPRGARPNSAIPPPIAPKPQRDRRMVQSFTDNVRTSGVMTPVQSSQSEAQRMLRSRQVLSSRRSTQSEAVDDSVFTDGSKSASEETVDYKALCVRLQEEVETLRETVATLTLELEVQQKLVDQQSKVGEYEERIKELEHENSTLKHEKALEEMRTENDKLQEENRSLIRVISKMSMRNCDVDVMQSNNNESKDFSPLGTYSDRTSPVNVVTRL